PTRHGRLRPWRREFQKDFHLDDSERVIAEARSDRPCPHPAPTLFHGRFFRDSSMDIKTNRPSAFPNSSSAERSGCGIMPSTFPSALRMPAILSREPFGLASTVTFPSEVQYRNTT